ncbi:MAG: hypothetical protein ABII88_04055 [Candidatus Omnitrophota bacterium]
MDKFIKEGLQTGLIVCVGTVIFALVSKLKQGGQELSSRVIAITVLVVIIVIAIAVFVFRKIK